MNSLISISAAADLIRRGQPLSLAAEESVLDQLPAGPWVAGTIPYFMADNGGVKSKDLVFVTEFPSNSTVTFAYYPTEHLEDLVKNAPANGFTLAIIPAGSLAHATYAYDCRNYEDAFLKPTVGWIAGVDLDNLGVQTAKIYDGANKKKYVDGAVVAYVALPASQLASIDIVNIFEPDNIDIIRFPSAGFSASECLVNGEPTKFAAYVEKRGNGDGKLPLVGDFAGARANVSFQSINQETGAVAFYAPVFTDVEYWLAKPVTDYAGDLSKGSQPLEELEVGFSCNCILNYVYGNLEGKKVGHLFGPITFGEIGYQLLNQTLVALRID